MDKDLRTLLYYGVDSVSKGVRAGSTVWLENASVTADGSLACLQFCCIYDVVPVVICVDIATGLAFIEAGSDALAQAITAVNAKNLAAAMSPSSASTAVKSPSSTASTSLYERISEILKELRKRASGIWPQQHICEVKDGVRSALIGHALDTMTSLSQCAVSFAKYKQCVSPYISVISGLHGVATLFSNALRNIRSPVVCAPVPYWAYNTDTLDISNTKDGSSTKSSPKRIGDTLLCQSPVSRTPTARKDWDAAVLDRAVLALPPISGWFGSNNTLSIETIEHCLRGLSFEGLLLIHWLLACCPVRLLRVDRPDVDAAGSFCVVRGPSPPTAVNATLTPMPLWDCADEATYGKYVGPDKAPMAWYHGTASDNLYSTLNHGLRVMSGTRHERTGAMYGDGVYCVNDPHVAKGFSKRTGVALVAHGLNVDWANPRANAQLPAYADMPFKGIFEMEIIDAPENKVFKAGSLIPRNQPVPPASYLVVPKAQHLEIRCIHLFHDQEASRRTPPAGAAVTAAGPRNIIAKGSMFTYILWGVLALIFAVIASRWRR